MIHRDYNGTGKWTVAAVKARYTEYAARFGVTDPQTLSPKVHIQGEVQWTYPIMDAVIDGIKAGDPACSAIGVEFIEEDCRFPFGRRLKSTTARALRQTQLSRALIVRIQRRITDMLLAGDTPREFREYAKLLRKVGFDEFWPRIQANPPHGSKYAMRYFGYFRSIQERSAAVVRLSAKNSFEPKPIRGSAN